MPPSFDWKTRVISSLLMEKLQKSGRADLVDILRSRRLVRKRSRTRKAPETNYGMLFQKSYWNHWQRVRYERKSSQTLCSLLPVVLPSETVGSYRRGFDRSVPATIAKEGEEESGFTIYYRCDTFIQAKHRQTR